MPGKPKVVLVGCGGISGAWMTEPIRKRINLVGLVDLSLKAAEQRQEDFQVPDAVTGKNLAAIIKKTDADIVFNCTIPEAHHSVTMTALKQGCHVLEEKPLANSMAEAREMVTAARKAKRIFAVIQNRRYQPEIRSLRAFLESGKIGKITTVQSNFFIGAHFGGFRDEMKNVLLLDMAIHSFDQARLISGEDAKHVYCHEWNPSGSWYKHGASAMAIFEMSNNVVYSYQGSWCSEGKNTSWECDWRIIGEKGSVLWDGGSGFKAERVNGKPEFTSPMKELTVPQRATKKKCGAHSGIILEFLDCVSKGGQPETQGSDNIKSLAMVFGAIESAKTKSRVRVR
jgi:predicted dehydrogenase